MYLRNEVCCHALVAQGAFGRIWEQIRPAREFSQTYRGFHKCMKTCENILHFFYKIIFFLNQQNKEFASKQNFNNLMIKIYFYHKNQSESFWTNFVGRDVISSFHAQMKHG
jgi:hypothetical protein